MPGQADNDDAVGRTGPLDTLPGATSADVHTGLGHPGQGQTSTELRHDGQHTSKKDPSGPEGAGAPGGSGLREDGLNTEFRRLREDGDHPRGPVPGHNAARDGAETLEPASAEEVAAEVNRSGR